MEIKTTLVYFILLLLLICVIGVWLKFHLCNTLLIKRKAKEILAQNLHCV